MVLFTRFHMLLVSVASPLTVAMIAKNSRAQSTEYSTTVAPWVSRSRRFKVRNMIMTAPATAYTPPDVPPVSLLSGYRGGYGSPAWPPAAAVRPVARRRNRS